MKTYLADINGHKSVAGHQQLLADSAQFLLLLDNHLLQLSVFSLQLVLQMTLLRRRHNQRLSQKLQRALNLNCINQK